MFQVISIDLSFTYDHTGIKAIDHFNLQIKKAKQLQGRTEAVSRPCSA
jgi:hypothetical protein